MKIEILGMGCAKCRQLEANVRTALGKGKADIVKVTDPDKIVDYDVMSTPALVINGKVKASGRIPEPAEISGWLKR